MNNGYIRAVEKVPFFAFFGHYTDTTSKAGVRFFSRRVDINEKTSARRFWHLTGRVSTSH